MQTKRSNRAVSEVVGTILLLQISIALFSIVYFSVLTLTPDPIKPSVNLLCTIEGDNIILENRGGSTLDTDTEVIVTIGSTEEKFQIDDYLNDKSEKNGLWDIGERVVYPTSGVTDLYVHVTVVDVQSNSAIMTGVIQSGT
jgi:hypothetical protein